MSDESLNRGASAAVPAGERVLTFENVSRHFGAVRAVDGVTFHLNRGEILTLLGPSGCGKTTTLRMAIGLERATSGRIAYRGYPMDCPTEGVFVPPERRDMGMVFQSYAIWPHLNVFENVAFPLRVRKMASREVGPAVREVLALLGLAGLEDRSGMALSGGQQQRVAVARGLVARPDVLLMDEPFSNLDAKLRDQVRTELKLLQRRLNISILFVTHDQSEALALSDRIAVMSRGRIEQLGTPLAVYATPTTPFVRDFVGQSIKLAGRVLEVTDGAATVRLDGGQTVQAHALDRLATRSAGAPCLLTIRPEDVRYGPVDTPSGAAANSMTATIRTLLFLGRDYEAIVELSANQTVTLYLPRNGDWREGQSLALTLPPERLQLWDAGAAE